jgi:hypothetical protein
MKSLNKIILTTFFAISITGCEYHSDRLKIQNQSKCPICYVILIYGKTSKSFYEATAGGEVKPFSYTSPIVRRGDEISYQLDRTSFDKKLYIIFYDPSYRSYVMRNIRTIVFDKKYTKVAFNITELDSLGWVIKYNGLCR